MLIICCGMPRSGSTLQFNMVWKCVNSANQGERLEWQAASTWENQRSELLSAVADSRIFVMKIHKVPKVLKDIAEEDGRVRFVYIHRDIRDVVYSMKVKFNFSVAHALARVGDSAGLEEWLVAGPEGAVLVQEYEDVFADPLGALQQVDNWIGTSLDPKGLARIHRELT